MGHQFNNGFRTMSLRRGDVIWLKLDQNLTTPAQANDGPAHKIRPFIVLNTKIDLRLDNRGRCVRSETLIGIDGTTKEGLVDGRPHICFEIADSGRDTYALTDSLRTIEAKDRYFNDVHKLSNDQIGQLMTGLDAVLQPEQRFFMRSHFNGILLPGSIWSFRTPMANQNGMILLRRGRFFVDGYDGASSPNDNARESRFSPYLVAAFRQEALRTLRGITWKDVTILAVPQSSFINETGSMNEETVALFLNNLRQRVGLEPITYKRPVVRSALNRAWLGLLIFRKTQLKL